MTFTILFLGCIAFLVVLIPLQIALGKRKAQQERKRAIEAGMRQSIIDQQTEREVAAKLLREAGRRP